MAPRRLCASGIRGRCETIWVHNRWRLLEHNAGTLPEPVLSDDR